MDIDAVIAEATQATEQPAEVTEVVEPQKEVVEDIGTKPDSELTPEQLDKRERNRESHLKSKLARITRENREIKARLAHVEKPPESSKPTKPTVEEYEKLGKTWEEYNEALIDWKQEQNTAKAAPQQNQQPQPHPRSKEWESQETQVIKAAPDYEQLLNDNSDFIDNIHKAPETARQLQEADNPTLALYALMKEGIDLYDLEDLPPNRLAAEIAKAEIRGQQYLQKPKAVTNAPKPMESSRGTASGGKPLEKQSVDELMKKFELRT